MNAPTDHAAHVAARLKARQEEEKRIAIAIRFACSLGTMLRPDAFAQNGLPVVRVYPEYIPAAPVSYDWRTNMEA